MTEDKRYAAIIEGPENEVFKTLQGISGMKEVITLGKRDEGVYEYTIEAVENVDVRREVFKRLAERNWPLLGLRSSELTLEDVFLKLTKDSNGGTN